MAHCPIDQLADLDDVFAAIRSWPNVREPTPGIFYFKRIPFLHFHTNRQGRRWADIRDGTDWGPEVDLPFAASAAVRRRFVREAHRRYARLAAG